MIAVVFVKLETQLVDLSLAQQSEWKCIYFAYAAPLSSHLAKLHVHVDQNHQIGKDTGRRNESMTDLIFYHVSNKTSYATTSGILPS